MYRPCRNSSVSQNHLPPAAGLGKFLQLPPVQGVHAAGKGINEDLILQLRQLQ